VYFESTQTTLSCLVGSIQPFKRLVFLIKGCINFGKQPRLDILLFGSFFPVIQLPSPVALCARGRGLCESCYLVLAGSSQGQIFLIGCGGFLIQPLCFIHPTDNVIGTLVIWAYQKYLTLGGASQDEVAGFAEAAASDAESYWRWKLDYWKERAKQEYVQSWQFAKIYAALDEKDQAFEWLDRAYEARESSLRTLKVSPQFDPLRDDPRFQDLLRRMNLEP